MGDSSTTHGTWAPVALAVASAGAFLFKKHEAGRRLLQRPATQEKTSEKGVDTTPAASEVDHHTLFRELPDGRREIFVPGVAGKTAKVVLKPTRAEVYKAYAPMFRRSLCFSSANKVGINKKFFRQVEALLRIVFPSWRSKETFMILFHTLFLILRTYLSLLVARVDGNIVGELVSANRDGFLRGLRNWYLLAIPSILTNAAIRFLQQELALSFRVRLTRYAHDLYMSDRLNFYKLLNLDARIEAADQYLTTDISRFCSLLAALYSNLSKPTLDMILFNYQLSRSIGPMGTFGIFVSYYVTGWVLRKVTPSFGKLAAIDATLEGEFRIAHSRIVMNAEEIAFYNGGAMEKSILNRAYNRIVKHVMSIYNVRIHYNMIEDLLVKYIWSATGYCLISLPVFFGVKKNTVTPAAPAQLEAAHPVGAPQQPEALEADLDESADRHVASRTENYMSNRRLLLSLADAGSRLMYSWKDLAELAGYTARVYTIITALHDLDANNYIGSEQPTSNEASKFFNLADLRGKVIFHPARSGIQFDHVPVVAPNPGNAGGGELLVDDVRLIIEPGHHLMITGPNASGKTSIARVLAGLWPVYDGSIRRPVDSDMIFLPQRPYLSYGTLRDQIIYPHAYSDFVASGKTDADLSEILKYCFLAYLPDREGGFDTVKEWKDVLSGGEKQRMGMARLFYHKPKFAVLDECTSAVSTDVEGSMYAHAKGLGITLITISHRSALFKYHDNLVTLHSDSKWEFRQLGAPQAPKSLQKDLESIETELALVAQYKEELKQIEEDLKFPENQVSAPSVA